MSEDTTRQEFEASHARDAELAAIRAEIIATWRAMQGAGQSEAYRILERMVDRLCYGRTDGNPSLAQVENEMPGGAPSAVRTRLMRAASVIEALGEEETPGGAR